jgi:hypothetical protein
MAIEIQINKRVRQISLCVRVMRQKIGLRIHVLCVLVNQNKFYSVQYTSLSRTSSAMLIIRFSLILVSQWQENFCPYGESKLVERHLFSGV